MRPSNTAPDTTFGRVPIDLAPITSYGTITYISVLIYKNCSYEYAFIKITNTAEVATKNYLLSKPGVGH